MRKRSLRLLFLISILSSFCIAQTRESQEAPEVPVPDYAMEQIVKRVLVWYFKPRKRPRVIYLADERIKRAWLPTIKNVDFCLLSLDEIERRKLKVYFFTGTELDENTFTIGFAFGDPHCSYSGDNWQFRMSQNRVRLWEGGSVGGGCGHADGRGGSDASQ